MTPELPIEQWVELRISPMRERFANRFVVLFCENIDQSLGEKSQIHALEIQPPLVSSERDPVFGKFVQPRVNPLSVTAVLRGFLFSLNSLAHKAMVMRIQLKQPGIQIQTGHGTDGKSGQARMFMLAAVA